MDDIKVYKPTETQDTPFPAQDTSIQDTTQASANGVFGPQTTKEIPMPTKKIAQEVISRSLNTSTRKILGEFRFTPSGALQIGNFEDGQAGDIRISPGGIVARNVRGETTFSLDGDTGDAIFKGAIRASSFENDNFSVDADGNVIARSIALAESDNYSSGSGLNQAFTSGTQADVTGSTTSIVLKRASIVLILVTANGWVYQGSGSGDWRGNGLVRLIIDGVEKGRTVIAGGLNNSGTGDGWGLVSHAPMSLHFLEVLPIGTHEIKLTGAADQVTGTTYFNLYSFKMSHITLGSALP